MITTRSSGIFLHVTSLPGNHGIGTMGKNAFEFIDFLVKAKQKIWQICPLGPTGFGDSPYQCFSAFAGNPLLIDMEQLVIDGLIKKVELTGLSKLQQDKVDYGPLIIKKNILLRKAFSRFEQNQKFEKFCEKNSYWLDDFSLFMSIKDHFNGLPWNQWPLEIKVRDPLALEQIEVQLSEQVILYKFLQYIFFEQWHKLRSYANENGVQILGDIPIFVAYDSADAWANSELFLFNEDLDPIVVAGVPPDYFSETGQLWGNPLFNWEKMKKKKFSWWVKRIKANQKLYDLIRIDHFRGFAGYWAVPAGEKDILKKLIEDYLLT